MQAPIFHDRADAGRQVAAVLQARAERPDVVYGLARGGVPVAAEVARVVGAELDAVAVRKIGHPLQPELALGAVAAFGPPVVRVHGLDDEASMTALRELAARRSAEARELDARLHTDVARLDPLGRVCVLVDDGLATGATMVAACQWATDAGATAVTVAVPVGSVDGVAELSREADSVVCVVEAVNFRAVSVWYRQFEQVAESEVTQLLRESRERSAAS